MNMNRENNTEGQLIAAVLVGALLIIAVGSFVADLHGQAPQPVAIVTGPVSQDQAKQNRLIIESSWPKLPNGLIQIDRALQVPSNTVLEGSGETVLEQPYTLNPYPQNSVVTCVGQWPCDYLNAATFSGATATVADASRFVVGGYCWSHHRGVYDGQPQNVRLHVVLKQAGTSIALSSQPAANADYLEGVTKAVRAVFSRGNTVITATEIGRHFDVGLFVYTSDGQINGDEPHGELRRIVKVTPNQITLDSPLTLDYNRDTSLVIPAKPATGVIVRNLSLKVAQPSGRTATFFAWTYGLTCQNVTTTQGFGCTCSTRFAAVNCSGDDCAISNSSQVEVNGGTWKQVWCEGGAEQVDFHDLTIQGTPNDKNAFGGGSGSQNCSVRRALIQNCGSNLIGWSGQSLTISDVLISGSLAPNNAFISSDGLRIERCVSDGGWVLSGRKQLLLDVRGATTLGRVASDSGTAINVFPIVAQSGTWQVVQSPEPPQAKPK